MEPLQNGCRNKNVIGHKAPTHRRAADTRYANEGCVQPHYEPWREVVLLDCFPDEVLLEVGKQVELCGLASLENCKRKGEEKQNL